MHTDDGNRGDLYLRQIEPIAAYVPYLVVAGNHEDDGANFTNYASRFNMPNDPFGDSQAYSLDVGLIHLVAISSEYYGFFYEYGPELVHLQYAWLVSDLQKANDNRAQVPWILTYQHRPFYCSNLNSYECTAFENAMLRTGYERLPGYESLIIDSGVDFGFWGHEHSYERFYPVANRKVYNLSSDPYHNAAAPIYIVSGSGGCHSGHAWFGPPTPGSAARINDYGYSMLTVHNRTHLLHEQYSVEKGDGVARVVDSVWVSKEEGHVPSIAGKAFVAFPEEGDCEMMGGGGGRGSGRPICKRERHGWEGVDRLERGPPP